MLQSLHIENFALIEELYLTFTDGVTVFTGETGAGKSILLDAIGMLAGKRASASFVRTGAEAFLVEGAFFLPVHNEKLKAFLEAHHIEAEDGEIVVSRRFWRNGRGTSLVNGAVVPQAVVRRLGLFLLDIHGQYDSRLIFDKAYHVRLLDNFTARSRACRLRYTALYNEWKTLREEAAALEKDEGDKAHLLDVLDFQIKEIEEAKLKDGEDEALEEHIRRASHAEHITDGLKTALFILEGGERRAGMVDGIGEIRRSLLKNAAYDDTFSALAEKAETLSYELEELRDELLTYADGMDFDAAALDRMQSRLAAIEKLKRKYGFTVADILRFLAEARAERDKLSDSGKTAAALKKQIARKETELRDSAAELFRARCEGAARFREETEAALHRLGLEKSRISFCIEPMTDITPVGAASAELYFSANRGEAERPLAEVASGGEVSRIALALKTIFREGGTDRTVIFDEIDVGVSGQTGLQVAAHIGKLGRTGQVFCITHLPQTAAIADSHFSLRKEERDGRTVTAVHELDKTAHVAEIARMFSGNDTTEAGLRAAAELIKKVKSDD